MILEKITSPLLAHFSYMVADGGHALVIDPRRDIDVYLKLAADHNVVIKGIFETHRNEDIVTGGPTLADVTGAPLYRSAHDDLPYETGNLINDGDTFDFGDLTLTALHTPGHTLGHLSYLVSSKDTDLYLFSGDCLFYGDAGRTDFYGKDRIDEMTRKLYRSLQGVYGKIDNGVILLPAHGAGSACGSSIEDRPTSTLGYERATNKLFQMDEEEFVKSHGYMRLKPFYFSGVEVFSLKGPEIPLTFDAQAYDGQEATAIDCRSQAAYMGLHEKGVLHINNEEFSAYLGWFVTDDNALHLLTDRLPADDVENMFWTARRMGYDCPIYVSGDGYQSKLQTSDKEIVQTPFIQVKDLEKDTLLLDVRKQEELDKDKLTEVLTNRVHIPLQLLAERIDELDKDKHYYTLCGSGVRATIAASILEGAGIESSVILGGMMAINKSGKFE